MRGYSERTVFEPKHVVLLELATELVQKIASHLDHEGREIRCHELARALGAVFAVEVADGTSVGVDHSWLVLSRTTLLDPYVPGRLPMVQLVDIGAPTLIRLTYDTFRGERDDIRPEVVNGLIVQMQRELTPLRRSAIAHCLEGMLRRQNGQTFRRVSGIGSHYSGADGIIHALGPYREPQANEQLWMETCFDDCGDRTRHIGD